VLHVAERVPAVQMLKLDVQTPLWALKEALLLLQRTVTERTDYGMYQMWGASLLSRSDNIAPVAISGRLDSYLVMIREV
jgi:hypothetical protein